MRRTIALFGEAEKGQFEYPYYCEDLHQLAEFLGHPPPESRGLYYAIQALLYKRGLIFFRVREEGFSKPDYLTGLQFLKEQHLYKKISAVCVPGVASNDILDAVIPFCAVYGQIMLYNESDLYDYLTQL